MKNSLIKIARLAGVCLILAGCSSDVPGRPKPVPVDGKLLWEGKPVEGATVVFMPEDHGFAAAGRTDSEGRFRVQTFNKDDGAVPGKFKIAVRKFEFLYPPGGGEIEQQLLPLVYCNPVKSGLTATIEDIPLNNVLVDLKGAAPPKSTRVSD